MATERQRIEKLLADGKVSAEEAERLLAALEKSERDDAQAAPGPREEIKKPRLSRLALAGALCMPGAFVAALLVAGFAMIFTRNEEQIVGAVALVGLAVFLTGIGLSIGGLILIRRAPDELAGRKLAHLGIWLPVAVTVVVYTAVTAEVRRARRDREASQAKLRELHMLRELADEQIPALWEQMHAILVECSAHPASERPAAFAEAAKTLLDPAWAKHLEARANQVGLDDTNGFKPLLQTETIKDMRVSRRTTRIDEGRGQIVVTDGRRRVSLGVCRVGNEWRFVRTPPAEPTDAVEPEGDAR
ncbi:MAG: SHOCT-like domain-containing protein [Planctomycetota bacterium]|jgi:hypothetical protein